MYTNIYVYIHYYCERESNETPVHMKWKYKEEEKNVLYIKVASNTSTTQIHGHHTEEKCCQFCAFVLFLFLTSVFSLGFRQCPVRNLSLSLCTIVVFMYSCLFSSFSSSSSFVYSARLFFSKKKTIFFYFVVVAIKQFEQFVTNWKLSIGYFMCIFTLVLKTVTQPFYIIKMFVFLCFASFNKIKHHTFIAKSNRRFIYVFDYGKLMHANGFYLYFWSFLSLTLYLSRFFFSLNNYKSNIKCLR